MTERCLSYTANEYSTLNVKYWRDLGILVTDH